MSTVTLLGESPMVSQEAVGRNAYSDSRDGCLSVNPGPCGRIRTSPRGQGTLGSCGEGTACPTGTKEPHLGGKDLWEDVGRELLAQ